MAAMPTTAVPTKLSQEVDTHTWIFSAALQQGECEESD